MDSVLCFIRTSKINEIGYQLDHNPDHLHAVPILVKTVS